MSAGPVPGADRRRSRDLWQAVETVHSVAYFSPETPAAATELGLVGFWMGYVGFRAAPMGPVAPGVVEAVFFNFHRRRVDRAVPEAWRRADPGDMVRVRAAAAAASLRRLLGGGAETLADAVGPTLRAAVEGASPHGRPLFAANRDVAWPSDPVAALWQATTSLREHRGDGHVSLLTAAGLTGCEALVLFSRSEGIDPGLLATSRAWSDDEWAATAGALRRRGLCDGGGLSAEGRALRREIEERTDELAWTAYAGLPGADVDAALGALEGPARRIAAAGELPFPNPIGLPRPAAAGP